jgi:hypothetical protein
MLNSSGHSLRPNTTRVDSAENLQNANLAIEQYNAVLEQDPKNVNSIKGIAYLYLNMKKFDVSITRRPISTPMTRRPTIQSG